MKRQHKLAKNLLFKKTEKKHLTLNLFNNLSSADYIVITWEWECLHMMFHIKCLFKPLGVNCTFHQLIVYWCLGVNWRSLMSEDFPLSPLGPWELYLVPCLLSPVVFELDFVVRCSLLPESCSCTLFTGPNRLFTRLESLDSNKHSFVCVYINGWIYCTGPAVWCRV